MGTSLAKPMPGEAPATLNDVPFIIKTLTFHEAEMRAEAHEALKALAGEDLGPDPGPWTEWWNTRGQEVLRLRRDEEKIEQLFCRLKAAILEGRRDVAVSLVSETERKTDGPEGDARWLEEHRKELRQAYRDACIRNLEIEDEGKGTRARLTVNWGVLGYEHRDVLVERSGDDWRFASEPWGGHLIEQPKKPARARRMQRRIRLRPEEFYATGALAVGVVCVASAPLLAIYLAALGLEPNPMAAAAVGIGLFFAPLAVGLVLRDMKRRRSFSDHNDAVGSKRRRPPGDLPPGITAAMAFGCLALAPLTMLLFACLGVDLDPLLAIVIAIGVFMALLVVNRIRRHRSESKLPKENEGEDED